VNPTERDPNRHVLLVRAGLRVNPGDARILGLTTQPLDLPYEDLATRVDGPRPTRKLDGEKDASNSTPYRVIGYADDRAFTASCHLATHGDADPGSVRP
jgi:hypothetical protein